MHDGYSVARRLAKSFDGACPALLCLAVVSGREMPIIARALQLPHFSAASGVGPSCLLTNGPAGFPQPRSTAETIAPRISCSILPSGHCGPPQRSQNTPCPIGRWPRATMKVSRQIFHGLRTRGAGPPHRQVGTSGQWHPRQSRPSRHQRLPPSTRLR